MKLTRDTQKVAEEARNICQNVQKLSGKGIISRWNSGKTIFGTVEEKISK